jgi:uncharacterized membrane protein YhfC
MDLLTITHFLNWLLMIAIPILLGVYLTEKFHTGWRIWLIGGAIFIISQVFHIPFNNYLLNPLLIRVQSSLPEVPALLLISILLGLSAGVFEETARYGMFRWWIKDQRSWRSAILAGAGHGGVESIILGILAMLFFTNLMVYRNIDLSKLNLTLDQLAAARIQIQSYWNAPWYTSLFGALERGFTIPFHIAASVLVLQVFTRRPGHQRLGWLALAIFYHTLLDASAVFIARQWNAYWAEAVFAVFAVVDIFIIFALRQPEPEPAEAALKSHPIDQPGFTPTQVEETSENLENTRFQ